MHSRVDPYLLAQGQLVKPTISFSDLQACEELIHSFIHKTEAEQHHA